MARKRAIPLVDLSDFTKGDEASKKAFIKKLSKAFHEIGFVGVVNHGIPKALVNKFYAESQAFFMLPTEKNKSMKCPVWQVREDILWKGACQAIQSR